MITLVQFPNAKEFPNYSPFCLKLETYLKMSKTPYEVKTSVQNGKAPKQKFPIVIHEGKTIADTSFIIDYLKEKKGDPLDQGLAKEQKAIATAFQRMAEENLFFCLIYLRWQTEDGWSQFSRKIFAGAPAPIRLVIGPFMRRSVVRRVYGQGIGRHSRQEVLQILRKDLRAVADYLGTKKYFFGDHPASIDASLFGVLGNLLLLPVTAEQESLAKEFPNLVDYCKRIHKNYFQT